MADRVQVQQDLGLRDPRKVTSTPVDNYYRVLPNTVQLEGGGEFESLAQAVGVATPVIQKALTEEEKRQQEEEMRKGAEARLKNQKDFKRAVQDGLIRPAENPWFVAGYMRQDGRISGARYDEAMRTAWMTSDARNSDDPREFQKFQESFRAKWLDDNKGATPDWLDGFTPRMQQADNNLSAQHVAHRQTVIEQQARLNLGVEVNQLLDAQAEREADPVTGAVDPAAGRAAVARQIEALTADMVRRGLNGTDANKIIAENIAQRAIQQKDTSVLDVLDNVRTPGGKLSDITEVKALRERTTRHILDVQWQEQAHAWQLEDRPYAVEARNFASKAREQQEKEWDRRAKSEDKKDRVDALTSDLTVGILEGKAIDRSKLAALAKDSPEHANWVLSFRDSQLQRAETIVTNKAELSRAYERLAADPSSVDARFIFGGVRNGTWDMPAAITLFNERQQLMRGGKDELAGDPVFQDLHARLIASVGHPLTDTGGSGAADAGIAALEFRRGYSEIMASNATTVDKQVAIRKLFIDTIKSYNPTALIGANSPEAKAAQPAPAIRGEGGKAIPQSHIDYLRAHPETAAQFDAKHGAGSAAKVLGR